MKKRFSVLALTAVLAAALLSGCTGDQPGPKVTEAPEATMPVISAATEAPVPTEAPAASEAPDVTTAPKTPGEAGTTEGPAATEAPEAVIRLTSLAELPDAIAPGAVIELPEGTLSITEAFDESFAGAEWQYAYLVDYYDGYALVIRDVSDLTIRGAGIDRTELTVASCQADVLRFENCSGVTLEKMTLGHDVEPGSCNGAVIEVNECEDFELRELDLYGCGTYGVENMDSRNIALRDSVIHDCSYGILSCYYGTMEVTDCELRDCWSYTSLDVYDSTMNFTGCAFTGNTAGAGFAPADGDNQITFHDCSFGASESFDVLYGLAGSGEVTYDDSCRFDESVRLPGNVVTVSSTEELFETIAPNSSIVLLDGYYNMSEWLEPTFYEQGSEWNAAHPYVELIEEFDGIMARISDVPNLSIVGGFSSRFGVQLVVDPRYADVFCFRNCDGLTLANFTAGHTDTGECAGNVLTLDGCSDVSIHNCDLYGCGVVGIYADCVQNLTVTDSVIRDCSANALQIFDATGDIVFRDCSLYGNAWGISNWSNVPLVLERCYLDETESMSVLYSDTVQLIDCETTESSDWYEYPDVEDFYYPLDGLSVVPFDREVLRDTVWTAVFTNMDGWAEWLAEVKLTIDETGDSCTLSGYFEEPVTWALSYDSSGYIAPLYANADEYSDGGITLYADTTLEESPITLVLNYMDYAFYFSI